MYVDNIPGAYLSTIIYKDIKKFLRRELARLIILLDSDIYGKYLGTNNRGNPFHSMNINNLLSGYIRSTILFYRNISGS